MRAITYLKPAPGLNLLHLIRTNFDLSPIFALCNDAFLSLARARLSAAAAAAALGSVDVDLGGGDHLPGPVLVVGHPPRAA